MRKVLETGLGCLVLIGLAIVALFIVAAVVGPTDPQSSGSAPTPEPVAQATTSPATTAIPAMPTPTATQSVTQVVTARPTPRPTRTPTPQVIYAACDDVPTYLLRLDTQGRVAVERQFVPSQPDGDDDGFACGDQLEHRRQWAMITAAPTARPTLTARPRTTASACPTSAERRYLAALRKNFQEIGAGALLLGAMMTPLERNPEVILTDDFKIDFALTGAVTHGYANEILDRPRPSSPRLARIHERSRAMARSLKNGLDGMMRGIRLIDGAEIERGAGQMQVAESQMREVNRLIDRLCQ